MMGKELNKGKGIARGITDEEEVVNRATVINTCISVTECGKLAFSEPNTYFRGNK